MDLKIVSFGLTDIGPIRQKNEDFWVELPQDGFYALADGMGGHKAGEVAAKETVENVCLDFLNHQIKTSLDIEQISLELLKAIQNANKKIYDLSQDHPPYRGMGTTLCCLYFKENTAIYAHVGDSRIYLYRKKKLKQLTDDHSLINELIAAGHMEIDEPFPLPYKNIITKAIGPRVKVEPEIATIPVKKGDLFILCSDGLSDFVSKEKMALVLEKPISMEEKVKNLINLAKERKSKDNITLIMIEIL